MAILGDEHVRRLEVPVDDPLLVGGRETLGDLDRGLHRLADGQTSGPEAVAQALALEQLGDDVRNGSALVA